MNASVGNDRRKTEKGYSVDSYEYLANYQGFYGSMDHSLRESVKLSSWWYVNQAIFNYHKSCMLHYKYLASKQKQSLISRPFNVFAHSFD